MSLEIQDKAVEIPELGKAQASKRRNDPGTTLPELSKSALSGFFDELGALGEIKVGAADSGVSRNEAIESLKKLKELEANKPDPAAVARGALAGGAAGTASTAARGLATGDIIGGLGKIMAENPTLGSRLKQVGKGIAKGMGGALAGSAAFGATLPFARRYLDQEAEKAKLRDYLGVSRRGKVRREVAKTIGVG